ncbi:MAG: hypothetical protein WDN44_03250 [Sphingomonas sp.]
MTVSVANQLYRPSGLSEQGRLVLSLIDGGIQWLDWAMQDQQARYQFSDEGALVAGVQAGLHASRLLLLPRTGLAVSPVKLMTLSTADLRTLAQAETGDPARAADAAPVLAAQGLVTHDNLAAVPVFLQNLQVADAPLFQAMGLDDRFPVLALRNDPDYTAPIGSPLPREAAAFAVAQARTPQEFVDYYRVYLRRAALGTPADTPEQRAARAQQALDTLLPLSFGALDAPGVDGLVPPWEVVAAIREWLLTGRQIGFSRASLVVQQVVANAGYADQAGDDAAALVRDYLARGPAAAEGRRDRTRPARPGRRDLHLHRGVGHRCRGDRARLHRHHHPPQLRARRRDRCGAAAPAVHRIAPYESRGDRLMTATDPDAQTPLGADPPSGAASPPAGAEADAAASAVMLAQTATASIDAVQASIDAGFAATQQTIHDAMAQADAAQAQALEAAQASMRNAVSAAQAAADAAMTAAGSSDGG